MDPFTASLLASVASAAISGGLGLAGSNAEANAAGDAAQAQLQAAREAAARNEPWRQSGINALNFQNQWLSLPGVVDGGLSGTYDPANYGAGQPVAGHTGGGGNNLFIPLLRNGGDNWKTVATSAPNGFDYNTYMQQPDLAAEWAKPNIQALFGGNRDAYAYWHYNQFGKNEGRTLTSTVPTNNPTQGTTATGTGQPSIWDKIKANPLWTAATEGFLGVDTPAVNASFSTGGKQLSGAQKKALQDRSTARSYNALGDIYNQYAGISGTGFNATQATNNAAQTGAANAGNATIARGNALASGYDAIGSAVGNGISSAADAYFKYGPGASAGAGTY